MHGVGGSHAAWDVIAAKLENRARLIVYDLPGHAGSLHYPGAGPVKVAAAAVIGDLDRRGMDRVHLAGHSMGGAIAVLIASMAPERIASLTLVAPGGMGEEINGPVLERFAAAVTPDSLMSSLKEMSAPGVEFPKDAVAALADILAAPGQSQMLSDIVARIARGGRQGAFPREMLASLAMPSTVVWGAEDPVLPFAQTVGLPGNIKVVPIAGAGHMLLDEAPGAVVAAIEENIAADGAA